MIEQTRSEPLPGKFRLYEEGPDPRGIYTRLKTRVVSRAPAVGAKECAPETPTAARGQLLADVNLVRAASMISSV
jgi:hypothetical protein